MAQSRIFGYHSYLGNIPWVVRRVPTDRAQFDKYVIGWEWELEVGGESFSNAKEIVKALGFDLTADDDIVVSEDGSLDDGMEIISQPGNYGYHFKTMNLDAGCRKADELGYCGEEHGGAGLHFNISRDTLGHGHIDEAFMLLLLNNKHWMYDKFSRRANTRGGFSYCELPCNRDAKPITVMDLRRDCYEVHRRLRDMADNSDSHYAAISLAKTGLVEVRFMCSTTYPVYFKGALQLMFMMAYAVDQMTLEELCTVDYAWFYQVAKANGFQEFLDSCRPHRVNVNTRNGLL